MNLETDLHEYRDVNIIVIIAIVITDLEILEASIEFEGEVVTKQLGGGGNSFTPLIHTTQSHPSFTPLIHTAHSHCSFTPLIHTRNSQPATHRSQPVSTNVDVAAAMDPRRVSGTAGTGERHVRVIRGRDRVGSKRAGCAHHTH